MRIRKQKNVKPFFLITGDTLSLYEDDRLVLKDTIERPLVVNRIATFDVEGELGFKDGIGGIFGEAK